jgi:hypothetical protein
MYLPLNARFINLIGFAKEESAKLSLEVHLGTEHLLLGRMCLKDDPAVLFLRGLFVTQDSVKNRIRAVLQLDHNNNS